MNWLGTKHPNNPLNANLADGIARHGFRKWYERELLSGHAHMVLCFLAVIGMMAAMEAFKDASMADKIIDVILGVVSAGIGLWALRRYLFLLTRAEHVANQANCGQCGTYGLLQATSATPEQTANQQQPVRCKKCGHAWNIDLT
jgi:hypothetical protein